MVSDVSDFHRNTAIGNPPVPIVLDLSIPDYTIRPEFTGYSDFRISAYITGQDFLEVNGLSNGDTAQPGILPISMVYYNFHQLAVGHYSCQIIFAITAKAPDGSIHEIDGYTIEPELGVDGQEFSFSPAEIVIPHLKDAAPNFIGTFSVTCPGEWSLLNSLDENKGILKINNDTAQNQYFTGNQTLDITLSDGVNTLDVGIHRFSIWFYAPSGQGAMTVWVVVKRNLSTISVFPNKLYFTAIKGNTEAEPQDVFVQSPVALSNYVLSSQFEMTYEYLETPGNNFYHWHIQPKPANNFEAGNYQGFLMMDIDGQDYEVDLFLTVLSDYDSNYDKEIHFTKDNEILKFYSATPEDSYIRLTAEIKTFNNLGAEKTYDRIWSLNFLAGIAEINLGRELDDYLDLIDVPQPTNALRLLYKPLEIRITAREIKYEDETIANMFIVPYQYFLRGRQPIDHYWLNHFPEAPVRVTPNSIIQLNIYKTKGASEPIIMKRNGTVVETWQPGLFNANNYHRFMSRQFRFSTISNLEAGEKISFTYGSKTRTFIVIPEGPHSTHIGWVNQFEVLDTFEFTGEFSFPMEYADSLSKNYLNWNDFLRKVSSEKTQKLIISTGWIFKSDVRIIDDLLMAQKAFVMNFNSQLGTTFKETHLRVVPIAKNLVAFDSERSLYEFNVEFQINREHEDAIYLR